MATQAEKDFFNFIQKRVKSNYKYLGFSVYNLTAADIGKLKELGDKWGIPFEWLCNLMNHESAGTFNPAIKNSIGATGLIQFLTSTAKSLGTTTSALASLSFQGQLEWVDKYLDGWKSTWKKRGILTNGKVNDKFQQPDLFMTIFYPAAIGKPDYQFNSDVQKANGGIKTPMDYATKALKNPPFPLSQVPSTLPEYRRKVSGGDAGAIPGGDTGGGTGTGETGTTTPSAPPTPPIPPIPKIEENSVRFNVEQKDTFKAINSKHNFGDLFVVEEVPEDEMFLFQEEDLSGLGDEYKETGFFGPEEISYVGPDLDATEEVPDTQSTTDKGSDKPNTPESTTESTNFVQPSSGSISDKQVAFIKNATKATGVGPGGLCAKYTFNHANNYVLQIMGKTPAKTIYAAGGNANQDSYHKNLERLGYKRSDQGTVTKATLIKSLSSSNWDIGDVVAYWGLDSSQGKESCVKYGHTQIYTAGKHNDTKNSWSTDHPNNFGAGFVYNSKKISNWRFIILKAPKPK
jgi:hypothetical protein